jgi:hypothetical protein
MRAPDLLQHLRRSGLRLTLTPLGGLHVAPRDALTDEHRAAIRAERGDLVRALQAEFPHRSGNPLLMPQQGDTCHAGDWDDAEVATFNARQVRFRRLGRHDADHLAEWLALRDRQQDERRLCLECTALTHKGRCTVAARGLLPGADRRLEPVQTILHRCPGFRVALP